MAKGVSLAVFWEKDLIYSSDQVRPQIVSYVTPDICIFQAGSDDTCSKPLEARDSHWEEWVAVNLFALAQHLVQTCRVKRVVIMQMLHPVQPRSPVKYQVDVLWFSHRCDNINRLVTAFVQDDNHIFFLKHKGLYETDLLSLALAYEGTHPNYEVDYLKYF